MSTHSLSSPLFSISDASSNGTMTTSCVDGHRHLFKATLLYQGDDDNECRWYFHQGDDDDERMLIVIIFSHLYCYFYGDDDCE
jgi:hypothetical protein